MITEVSPTNTVVLDSSGNGQCSLGPPSGTKWALRLATVATSTTSKQPQAKLYRGSSSGPLQLLDNTYTGSAASSSKVGGAIYYPGQLLWAVWTGGDPGAVATLQAFGQQGSRNDPLPPSPLGEGFANPVVSQLIAGSPGGAHIVIGVTPIPTELVTYYAAGAPETVTPPETVVALTANYDGAGNYSYSGLVIDSSASKVTSLVGGKVVAGVVGEYSRTLLNPGVPGGAVQTALYNNELFLETSVRAQAVLAAGLPSDTVGSLEIDAAGAMFRGAGGAGDTDTVDYRASAGVLASDPIISNLVAGDPTGGSETWHALTLANLWVNQGAPKATAQYRMVPSPARCVEVVGAISGGTRVDGTTIATLPAGYRPTHTTTHVVYCSTTTAGGQSPAFNIDSTGAITCFGLGASTVNFHFLIPLDA